MEAASQGTAYRFGPLERMGFMLGLRVPQLLGMIVSLVIALVFLNNPGGFVGLMIALAVVAAGAGIFLKTIRSHTLEEWAPLTVRFLVGRFFGRARFRAQLAQVGHVVDVPDGGLEPETPDEPKALPAELATIEFLEGELVAYGGTPFGVIVDRRAKTMTAVVRCQGESFALLGAEDREQRLADYGGVLAALARDGSPVRRIAWTERTLPANRDQLAQYVIDNKREDLSLDDPSDELVSYFQLLRRAPDVAEDHVLLFSVQIDTFSASARQAIKRQGGGDLGGLAVLADELAQVIDLLDAAGISVTGALTRRGVAAAIRNAYDPWGRQQRERASDDEGLSPMSAGPMARDEHFSLHRGRRCAAHDAVDRGVAAHRCPRDVLAAAADQQPCDADGDDGDGARRALEGDPEGRAGDDRELHQPVDARADRAAHDQARRAEGRGHVAA